MVRTRAHPPAGKGRLGRLPAALSPRAAQANYRLFFSLITVVGILTWTQVGVGIGAPPPARSQPATGRISRVHLEGALRV